MKNTSFVLLTAILSIVVIQACKKNKADKAADKELFDELTQSGYSYYQGGNILSGVSPSPHGAFKLRFNSIAQAALDTTGELPTGASFPNESIIVKELYSGSNLVLYAVMKKDPSNKNAGNGWLWAEYETDGSTVFSISKKGSSCTSCHSGSPNRDLTRTFDLH